METILKKDKFLELFIRVVFVIGLISLSVAIVMFVAYNWDGLSRFEKFAIAQGAFALPILILMFVKNPIIKEVLLFSASILIGANLALIGQVYQSGADSWQLFALWAMLLLPFIYAQKSTSIYLLFIVIVNLSIYLYYDIYRWFYYYLGYSYLLIALALNTIFWLFSVTIKNRLLEVILAIAIIVQATIFAINNITNINSQSWLIIIYLAYMAAIYYFYRVKSLNMFYMQLFIISINVTFIVWASYHIFSKTKGSGAMIISSFIMLGVLMTSSYFSYKWIERLKEEIDD